MSQYRYKFTMERVAGADGAVRGDAEAPLQFEADNHDDLFHIVRLLRAKGAWSEEEAAQLAVGMKLFLEVGFHHRKDPLWEPLMPHLREFLGRVKAVGAAPAEAAEKP